MDQIGLTGELVIDVDTTLSPAQKVGVLMDALPGAVVEKIAGVQIVRFAGQIILSAQVTYLGNPWPGFKKRIQIPRRWVEVYRRAAADGIVTRFVGIYHYGEVSVFVDFDPTTYVERKANNSAAHVATNDLFQAQTLGIFRRTDKNGNSLTSLRSDRFGDYLLGNVGKEMAHARVFEEFNAEFLTGEHLSALDAVQQMHNAQWPDTMQAEWAGFYLEFRVDDFLRNSGAHRIVEFQKAKRRGDFDYDLIFKGSQEVAFLGDLKASSISSRGAPGNDAANLLECVAQYGRFWYVLYEHETWHSKDEGAKPVIAWNEWRRSVGYTPRAGYDSMSYARKFKSAVRFVRMKILEVNVANFHLVLDDFKQGRQVGGAERAVKVMIDKKNIDNFLIYSQSISV